MNRNPTPPPGWSKPTDLLGRQMGNCELREHLARGGMGDIYAAEHLFLGRPVAIKLPRFDDERLEFNQHRLLAEARFLAAVSHTNVVGVYDMGLTTEGLAYLVMELLEGQSLDQILDRTPFLSLPAVLHITREVARGIGACHRAGVVCSDVKPENIMVVSGPLVGRPPKGAVWTKMIDLGTARPLAAERAREAGTLKSVTGTPVYMSPEMALGDRIDTRSDLYSLGVLLYELIAGTPPFQHEQPEVVLQKHVEEKPLPLSEHRPEVPPGSELERLVAQCLAKEPGARPETIYAFLNLLDEAAWAVTAGSAPPEPRRDGPVLEIGDAPSDTETVTMNAADRPVDPGKD